MSWWDLFRLRSGMFWIVLAVTGSLLFTEIDQAAFWGNTEAVADDQIHSEDTGGPQRGAVIVYDEDDLSVRYGEYSETEFTLTGTAVDANADEIYWQVIDAQLPAGLQMDYSDSEQLLIHGTPLFLGRWCFILAAEMEEIRATRQICFYAGGNSELSYPEFSTNQNLDTARKGRRYDEKIRFERISDHRLRRQAEIVWHNLPNSLEIEPRSSKGYIKIKGRPEDRLSYRVENHSRSPSPHLQELMTVEDSRSNFSQKNAGVYSYRITAVYPDGETRSLTSASVTVEAGQVVTALITYEGSPFYFNVFRSDGEEDVGHKYITRLTPAGSGIEYLLDLNRLMPRKLSATGVFYLMLKLTDIGTDRSVASSYRQFALTIVPDDQETSDKYTCPAGYYYDRILRHCVQATGVPCPAGTYYEPEYGECRSYPYSRYCPTGFYFDHFLGRCVQSSYPRCPYNYRWYPFSNECVLAPHWCPMGETYNWFLGRCVRWFPQTCQNGWHYNYALGRCVRNYRPCAYGYSWDRRTGSCRLNQRRCRQGYHWSHRLNRCVYHGRPRRCQSGYRYDPATRRCVIIRRERRCRPDYHWSNRRGECVRNRMPERRRPTTRPPRSPERRRPTTRPSRSPERRRPTARPSRSPERRRPTARPSRSPERRRPTARPSRSPERRRPTTRPSRSPERRRPTARPSRSPERRRPTARPSRSPERRRPTARPSRSPERRRPTTRPRRSPERRRPTARPSRSPERRRPTARPSRSPERRRPTARPSRSPERRRPTARPSRSPERRRPTARPSRSPERRRPTARPSRSPERRRPTARPSRSPERRRPTARPSRSPERRRPTARPSRSPERRRPTARPSRSPERRRPTATPTRTPERRHPSRRPR